MQVSESYRQKKSLFNAMNRFLGAVNTMDQTVMVPNLLRDLPLDQDQDHSGDQDQDQDHQDGDMYGSYMLLKSIRHDIQWGVLQGDDQVQDPVQDQVQDQVQDPDQDQVQVQDLEGLFHFHLKGLHGVLSKLTNQAETLTSRYKQELGDRK